jgi:hypothetical protein
MKNTRLKKMSAHPTKIHSNIIAALALSLKRKAACGDLSVCGGGGGGG